jgi:hypothetical protein
MAPTAAARHARPMDDTDAIVRVRAAMARLGQSVDDLDDDQVRARAQALVGDRPDALDRIARTLEEPDPDEAN